MTRLVPEWRMPLAAILTVAVSCSDAGPTGPGGVAEVRFSPTVVHVVAWESITLTPSVTDAAGHPLAGRTVSWASDDTRIATVSQTGVVTGVASGQTRINATVGGKRGTATVNVSWPPVAEVVLETEEVALEEGSTMQLVATAEDAQGRTLTGLFIGWTSSRPDVAHVDALGRVSAIRPGTARIAATAQGKTADANVTVSANHPYDLLFQAFDGGTPSLWQLDLRDAAGVPARILPDVAAANPAPSPDGSRIAFVAGGIDPGIWIANRDGSGLRELVIGSRWSPVFQPAWSPDGTKIAYTRRPHPGPEQIWIVDVATGMTLLTTAGHGGAQSWPSWSPEPIDGSYRIAYAQLDGGRQQIWTMREDGTDRRSVTTGADLYDGQPAWSPDGETIAFQRLTVSQFDIWLVDADGGNERGLVGAFLAGSQSTPVWSPDGQLIAFSSTHETYGQERSISQIYTVRRDATGLARRTSGDDAKSLPAWVSRTP